MSITGEASPQVADVGIDKSGLAQEDISSIDGAEKQVRGANHSGHEVKKIFIDVSAELTLLRKLDTRLIPLLFALCTFCPGTISGYLLTFLRPDELYGPLECRVNYVVPLW
jgi:hypothetical protein